MQRRCNKTERHRFLLDIRNSGYTTIYNDTGVESFEELRTVIDDDVVNIKPLRNFIRSIQDVHNVCSPSDTPIHYDNLFFCLLTVHSIVNLVTIDYIYALKQGYVS